MFNFSWFDSNIHNFFLKNKVFLIISNFFSSISLNDFFRFRIASLIATHVTFFWFAVFILSNNDNSKFSSFISFNSCKICESTFFDVKIVWYICLFRSFESSSDRFSSHRVNESILSFFFSDWYAILNPIQSEILFISSDVCSTFLWSCVRVLTFEPLLSRNGVKPNQGNSSEQLSQKPFLYDRFFSFFFKSIFSSHQHQLDR